jgi:BlaI family transcriptional regulator, penicillinase repressor
MAQLKLTSLQYQLMDLFWEQGGLSVREVHTALSPPRPAYTTVQTLIGRLEAKGALKRTRKIGNAHLYEAAVSRDAVQRRVLDEFLSMFGGRTKLLMARLAESGKLTLDDVQEAERHLRDIAKKKGRKK